MFNDTIIFLLWLATTYFVVQLTFGIRDGIKETTDELETELRKRINDMVHRVKSEKKDDVLYWFDQDDGEFLGQGASYEELVNVLKARYPTHIFYFEYESESFLISANSNWKPVTVDQKTS